MGTGQGIAAVAAAVIFGMFAAVVCAFLIALLLPLLFAYRTELLRTQGATDFFHLFRLTMRGEASKTALLLDGFLLSVQLCLGISLLFLGIGVIYFPGAMIPLLTVSLLLGGVGGYCALNLPTAYYHSPSSHAAIMDKLVFLTVYTCCFVVCAHLIFFSGWNQFVIYKHVCVCVTFGSLLHFVQLKFARGVVISLCLVCGYIVFYIMRLQEIEGLNASVLEIALLAMNVCLGYRFSSSMVRRTNLYTTVVSLVFGGLVWLAFSQAIYFTKSEALALLAPWVKVEIFCVEMGQFCVALVCTCGFLLERGCSNTCLFHVVMAGVAINFMMNYKLIFPVARDVY